MTISEKIINFLRNRLAFTSTLNEMYRMRINRSSLRSSLSRMTKKGILKRIDDGIYKLEFLYRLFRHSKRIFDTHSRKPINKFDLDVEATSEGFVPYHLSISDVESVVNPHLEDETLYILSENGVYLIEERVDWKVTGSEWLDTTRATYKKTHEVEVILVNQTGKRYKFDGSFKVNEDEYG